MKVYRVKSIQEKNIVFSEKINQSLWTNATSLTDFSSPWDNRPITKIEFKAVHNSEKIFFQFKVDDTNVHVNPSKDKNESINNSDRVELFFRRDESLNPYYCLEIDSLGRVMDFKAKPNKNFDFNWNWASKDIDVRSVIEDNYFVVQIVISIQSLKYLSLLKEDKIETGIFRAKYNKEKDNSFQPTWISWVKPDSETPNFHIPSSFGVLVLEDYK